MPTTWKPWQTVNNIIYVINSGPTAAVVTPTPVPSSTTTTTTRLDRTQILDAYFPPQYTPANAFWLRSLVNNAIIPWDNAGDLFSNFALSGGTTANLIGAAAGLTYLAGQQYFQSKIFGLGYRGGISSSWSLTSSLSNAASSGTSNQDLNAPQMGYCIGDKFKQQVFVQFDVINTIVAVEQLQLPRIELMQNSKFKRIYVNHGEVVDYKEIANTVANTVSKVVVLDIPKDSKAAGITSPGGTIKISKKDGNTFSSTITGINNDWSLIVSGFPTGKIPRPGDFFELQGSSVQSKVWCIEDPLLLSGFWLGNETDGTIIPGEAKPKTSGLNLYVTTQNSPYAEGNYAGYYVYQVLPTTTTTTTGGGAVPAPVGSTTTTTTTAPIPVVGATMRDAGGFEWAWHRFVSEDRYKDDPALFGNAVALANSVAVNPDEALWSRRYVPRTVTTATQPPAQTFYRLDIGVGKGGSRYRNNWFAPCLKHSYLKNTDGYFKILAHVGANVIDVDIKNVTNTASLNINLPYQIINQYGWMINEHYQMSNLPGTVVEGVFNGNCTSITYASNVSTVTLQVNGDTLPTYYATSLFDSNVAGVGVPAAPADFGPNSFKNRFQKTLALPSGTTEPKAVYKKGQDWRLVFDRVPFVLTPATPTTPAVITVKDKEFKLNGAVAFPTSDPVPLSNSYSISFTVDGDATAFLGKPGYIAFDTPFPLLDPKYRSKQNGANFDLDVQYLASGAVIMTSTSGKLWLKGEYISNPYNVDFPSDTLIGFCEARYFGVASDRYPTPNSLYFRVTTPFLPRGIASLFHALREEDWIVYEDSVTKKVTARRGSLHFNEYPMKSEIAVSEPSAPLAVTASGSAIELSTDYDRLRRLKVKVPNTAVYLMFGIDSIDNIYGFYVSGDGIVDLEALRMSGSPPGTIPSTTYKGEGQIVSPVYQYQKQFYQNISTPDIDVSVDTSKNQKVFFINGSVAATDVKAQYTNNNYVLGDGGLETTLFDIYRTTYGEIIMVYGQTVDQFTCNGNLNNSQDNNTSWRTRRGVMMISTNNDAFVWGTPLKRVYKQKDYQYPLLVLNDCDYLASIYDQMTNNMSIFVNCIDPTSGKAFVGCFTLAISHLLHWGIVCKFPTGATVFTAASTAGILYGSGAATTTTTTTLSPVTSTTTTIPVAALPVTPIPASGIRPPIDFMWRPPLLKDSLITDASNTWSATPVVDSFSYTDNPVPGDVFVRVLGPSVTKSRVVYEGDVTYASSHQMDWGSYIFLYATNEGIKGVYSNDSGMHWGGSDIIFARNANCPLIVGRYMFYITPLGIEVKDFAESVYGQVIEVAMKKLAGIDVSADELSIQNTFDNDTLYPHRLIGSGEVDLQRLAGYITDDGIIKLFFYNPENLLTCMESSGAYKWTVSSNF